MTNPWPRFVDDAKLLPVYKVGDGVWMVPSKKYQPGAWWRVTWWNGVGGVVTFTCTCPKGTDMGAMKPNEVCRHVHMVAKAEKDDGVPPRPSAKINPSAFVD